MGWNQTMDEIYTFGCWICGEIHGFCDIERAETELEDFRNTECSEGYDHQNLSIVVKDRDEVF